MNNEQTISVGKNKKLKFSFVLNTILGVNYKNRKKSTPFLRTHFFINQNIKFSLNGQRTLWINVILVIRLAYNYILPTSLQHE